MESAPLYLLGTERAASDIAQIDSTIHLVGSNGAEFILPWFADSWCLCLFSVTF